jgi:hypothetical protein
MSRHDLTARWLRRLLTIGGLCFVLLCSSCGDGRKAVYLVRGEVLDAADKPATGAVVVFNPVNPDPKDPLKPVGKVDDSGHFSLTSYKENDGAPVGEYTVTITWPTPRKTPMDPDLGDQLKGRYATPEKSTIRATVEKKGANDVPTIHLK